MQVIPRLRKRAVFVLATVPLIMGLSYAPATASTVSNQQEYTQLTNSNDPTEVIGNYDVDSTDLYILDEATAQKGKDGQTFYPMPASAEDDLVISPEVAKTLKIKERGKVSAKNKGPVAAKLNSSSDVHVGGESGTLTPTALSVAPTAIDCTTAFYTAPGGTSWGKWTNRRCSLITSGYHDTFYYQWSMNGVGSQSQSCVQGYGLARKYDVGGTFLGMQTVTKSLGCGKGGGGSVPWEKVADIPKIKTKASYLGLGGTGYFS